jgi:pyridinium-3,5-biscarboxylic acid mononucleotide synthase
MSNRKNSIRGTVFVNHEADDQLELLKLLLQEQPSRQHRQESEQQSVNQLSSEVKQEFQNSQRHGHSSEIETRPDPGREQRKGVPEVIFGETKDVAQITEMARGLLDGSGRAIISRVPLEAIASLQAAFQAYTVSVRETARAVVIYKPGYMRQHWGGKVGVISAGTSDIPVAEEAALIAEEMGCEVTCIYDVGVAGLHRLIEPLRNLLSNGVDAIVVAAGMDGALPSVIAGLVPVPVIGLPTSIGYGLGGKGVAALLSMLQTCAPGLSVVNIDNGVGAGITAALIANRVAQAREHHLQ